MLSKAIFYYLFRMLCNCHSRPSSQIKTIFVLLASVLLTAIPNKLSVNISFTTKISVSLGVQIKISYNLSDLYSIILLNERDVISHKSNVWSLPVWS